MSDTENWEQFRAQIGAARALLGDPSAAARGRSDMVPVAEPSADASLPSLLEQCLDMLAAPSPAIRPSLRTVHQLACVGGTLINRCIASMPNTKLLSEVDPLSPIAFNQPQTFVPTDLIRLDRASSRPSGDDVLTRIFLAGTEVLYEETRRNGVALILRDHAHGQFSFGDHTQHHPTLMEMLEDRFTLRSLVIVRHPMESFLSLRANDWLHFSPPSLKRYSELYLAFLDHFSALPILRYEDFLQDPQTRMQETCDILDLSYNPDFIHLFPDLQLSGDSGRGGDIIKERPRKPVPPDIAKAAAAAPAYRALCARLGYAIG
ncbi:sulfotransferase family protein [Puniceibacterium sp. IMCC21224]|uniref:sulfotransferase family protein n=1 Tax=Puniceibacterium sp. IMCC21224 TaxID=1618204 RepID=UPI00064DCC93|nr:sulfotransferase family protein [Puniceibacterium sp. IMCC21224]KMK63957.1 hypothetical protein IMCC21224_1615 [Puniceibacterium sp. IMCC21224]